MRNGPHPKTQFIESHDQNGCAGSCRAALDGAVLILGNSEFEERWHIVGTSLRLDSFSPKGRGSWVLPTAPAPAEPVTEARLETAWGCAAPCETPSLQATLTLQAVEKRSVFSFRVFPGIAGSIARQITGESLQNGPVTSFAMAEGIETDTALCPADDITKEYPFAPFPLGTAHLLVTEVQFTEQSDQHGTFVTEREWITTPSEFRLPIECNLVGIENPATSEGFVLLLLAPTRFVRGQWTTGPDFLLETTEPAPRASFGVRLSVFPGPYPLARIAYSGGAPGRTTALHRLQRALHAWTPGRDGLILSNTWGDRSRADKLSEAFMLQEIAAAQELGVEVMQIDDGWQKGSSANTVESGGVWNGFWDSDPTFWEPHPERFPHGLAPVAEAAKRAGLRLGLWYAPDSTHDLVHWEKDAAMLTRYWCELGVAHYKLDAIKLHSRLAEQRFLALLDAVHQATGGAVLFDLDATAEHRETYFGHPHGSTLFLENRYTDRGSYYPHQTLRALWTLARYIWPPRLRLEFLNPARNDARYQGDPLRPAAYPPETLFAIAMTASPLAFLENSGLSPEVAARFAALIRLWKPHREAWFAGNLQPIGDCPDGWTWSGFSSLLPEERTGYVLLFRQLNRSETWEGFVFSKNTEYAEIKTIAGDGTVTAQGNRLCVHIPKPLGFVFARVRLTACV